MNKMKILITGASGFLGKSLIKKLTEKKIEVLALSRTHSIIFDKKNVKWLKFDFSNIAPLINEIKKFKPEIVYHFYWEDIPNFNKINSLNSLNRSILFFSEILNFKSVRKVVVSGSCLEYEKNKGICKETFNTKPKRDFTWAKNTLRNWLEIQTNRRMIQFYWLRVFYVFGPWQRSEALIPYILNCLSKKKMPEIENFTNGNDYIYIDDAIEIFLHVTNLNIPSGIYNVGTGKSVKVYDIFSIAENIVNKTNYSDQIKHSLKNQNNKIKNIDFWSDMTKTKMHFNYDNFISTELAIKKTYDFLRKNYEN